MKSITEIHNYWKNADEENAPENYLDGQERTDFLVRKILKYCEKSDVILEIGCNVGRNLNGLYEAGFKNLIGIEINKNAIKIMYDKFPKMASGIKLFNFSAEITLNIFPGNEIDTTFTMAILEHVHPESEKNIFNNIKRVTKNNIITIEDEYTESDRHCPRNYRNIFEGDKFKQIKWQRKIKGVWGLSNRYVYRLFKAT